MEELKQWIEKDKGWDTGLMLLSKYGRPGNVTILRRMGPNNATRKTLVTEIKSLYKRLNKPESTAKSAVSIPATSTPTVRLIKATEQFKPDNTGLAAELKDSANKVYQEMGMTHARLLSAATDEERAKLRYQLIDVQQKKFVQLMYQHDYVHQHGVMPPTNTPVPKKKTAAATLDGKAHQELTLLRSKVTRAEREQIPAYEAAIAKNPDNKKAATKLANRKAEVIKWRERIEELEKGNNG
jgi:hypothetical protein